MLGFFERFMKRKRPLVVHIDDDADVLTMTRAILGSMDLDVVSVADGTEGVRIVKSRSPDLVILDIRMPRLDGLGVCRLLKSAPETKAIPILMLTAMGQHKDVEDAFAQGADGYVVKPMDLPQFREKVSRMLGRI